MNKLITLAATALLATPAWAGHLDGNAEVERSILNVHAVHFPHAQGDSHEPERGRGASYGSILLDRDSHTPHTASDNHAPEKGTGDDYGSVHLDSDRPARR